LDAVNPGSDVLSTMTKRWVQYQEDVCHLFQIDCPVFSLQTKKA